MKKFAFVIIGLLALSGCAGTPNYGTYQSNGYYTYNSNNGGYNNQQQGGVSQLRGARQTACRAWGVVSNSAWNSSTYTYACALTGMLGL